MINSDTIFNYIQETNDMIEHLKYINKTLENKINKINDIVDKNTYIDFKNITKYIDEDGIKKIKEVSYGTNHI